MLTYTCVRMRACAHVSQEYVRQRHRCLLFVAALVATCVPPQPNTVTVTVTLTLTLLRPWLDICRRSARCEWDMFRQDAAYKLLHSVSTARTLGCCRPPARMGSGIHA